MHELEDLLDRKTAQLLHLQRLSIENTRAQPRLSDEEEGQAGGGGSCQPSGSSSGHGGASPSKAVLPAMLVPHTVCTLADPKHDPSHPSQDGARAGATAFNAAADVGHSVASPYRNGTKVPSAENTIASLKAQLQHSTTARESVEQKLAAVERERSAAMAKLRAVEAEVARRAEAYAEQYTQQYAQQLTHERQRRMRQRSTVSSLRNRCVSHAKERRALVSILENKVGALLDRLAEQLNLAEGLTAEHAARATRDVGMLQRLVGASLSALKMPEGDNDGSEEAWEEGEDDQLDEMQPAPSAGTAVVMPPASRPGEIEPNSGTPDRIKVPSPKRRMVSNLPSPPLAAGPF